MYTRYYLFDYYNEKSSEIRKVADRALNNSKNIESRSKFCRGILVNYYKSLESKYEIDEW